MHVYVVQLQKEISTYYYDKKKGKMYCLQIGSLNGLPEKSTPQILNFLI